MLLVKNNINIKVLFSYYYLFYIDSLKERQSILINSFTYISCIIIF
jgi:hypothetical protein